MITTDRTDTTDNKGFLYKVETYRINGCIFEVNKKLGSGFLEAVYQEALAIELGKAEIPFEPQKEIEINYDGKPLQHHYIADFLCYDKIIIEIKAVSKITNEYKAQLLNYLTATQLRVGLLVNFCSAPQAEIIRMVR